ncbi:hypothetical protein DXT99_23160 [Pontibacter diazotrophicus]|uniref:Uncharacterized protein n=1 Tax=Pontibacter diazotrophicus TaxID=1400979 RepID=A0A3D8L3T8_9BACT|nr:hypothetical protein [Pontibacter diazotrophicus]RDV11927.1 hypothetical protein DXT99_23160 [Pontibacter diazotrophicus]
MKKVLNIFIAGVFGTAIGVACTNGTTTTANTTEATAMTTPATQAAQPVQQDAKAMVNDWPETAKMAANNMMISMGSQQRALPAG